MIDFQRPQQSVPQPPTPTSGAISITTNTPQSGSSSSSSPSLSPSSSSSLSSPSPSPQLKIMETTSRDIPKTTPVDFDHNQQQLDTDKKTLSADADHNHKNSALRNHINMINRTQIHIKISDDDDDNLAAKLHRHQMKRPASPSEDNQSETEDDIRYSNSTENLKHNERQQENEQDYENSDHKNTLTITKLSPNQESSPGYHSAASSPNSSIASPVSSSSSNYCSSGVSSAGSSISVSPPRQQTQHQATTRNPANNSQGKPQAVSSLTNRMYNAAPRAAPSSSSSFNLFEFFPDLGHDSRSLSWFHDVNSRSRLNEALASKKMIVSGDISLAEMSRYPVPIMARTPLGVSDITLENWLQEVVQSRKAMKLTFTSTRTVEPAFRILAKYADQIKGPLILSADILSMPSNSASESNRGAKIQQHQPVDAWTFLMLCRTRFPRSIISIGWCLVDDIQSDQSMRIKEERNFSQSSNPESMMFEMDMVHDRNNGNPLFNNVMVNPHQIIPDINSFDSDHALATAILNNQQYGLSSTFKRTNQSAAYGNKRNSINQHQLYISHNNVANSIENLSSTASLNSSSGNSSGSPSPTSPIDHLISPSAAAAAAAAAAALAASRQMSSIDLHRTNQHNPYHNNHNRRTPDSSNNRLINLAALAAAHCGRNQTIDSPSARRSSDWTAMAAMVAHLNDSKLDSQVVQQSPLNLNINEAELYHSTERSTSFDELTQRIQSLKQQQDQLVSRSHGGQSKSLSYTNTITSKQNWAHISKKTAITNRLNNNSPSPKSSSPRQRSISHQPASNLLCVKATAHQINQSNQKAAINDSIGYTREMIDKMASLVKEYNLIQPITFPVEARLLCKNSSLSELQRLLYQVGGNSTLTVVAQQEDLINVEDLLVIIKHFNTNQILFDLPDDLAASLRQELETL